MLDRKPNPAAPTTVGAYEAKTKFSELIARAEKGESFVVTKNGRPVAEIKPVRQFDREAARRAGERIRARLDAAPTVSEEEAQRNYEEHKADIERERRRSGSTSGSSPRRIGCHRVVRADAGDCPTSSCALLDVSAHGALVPSSFWYEVFHGLRRLERRGIVPQAEIDAFYRDRLELDFSVDPARRRSRDDRTRSRCRSGPTAEHL